MDVSEQIQAIVWSYVGESPLILAAVLGMLFTVVRWVRLGPGALPAFAGCACLLLVSIYLPLHYNLIMSPLVEKAGEDGDYDRIEVYYQVSHFVMSLGLAIGAGLLILGVHMGRADSPSDRP